MLPVKILLFSADIPHANTITASLVDAGYKIIHRLSGVGALELIHVEKPDLVILDRELPDFSSMAIIRSIRAEEGRREVPIVLVGSNLKEEDVLLGLEIGADLCLNESFHPQVFTARIHSLIRRTATVKTH